MARGYFVQREIAKSSEDTCVSPKVYNKITGIISRGTFDTLLFKGLLSERNKD